MAAEAPPSASELHRLEWIKWVDTILGLEPRWNREPNLEAVKHTLQSLYPSATVDATFLAQGAFNKVYNATKSDKDSIMRVSLPVDPQHKTLSEVATLDWIRRTTSLPVPRVIAHQPSRENSIGLEWILMTKVPGKSLADRWRSLTFDTKSSLVYELAAHSASLFRNQLRGIGNIYPDSSLPYVGRIVSMHFFWGDRVFQDVNRGPFRCARDWIAARLALSENDCHSTLGKYPNTEDLDSDGEDEVDDATRTLGIINRLKPLLSRILPADGQDLEASVLFHNDLSRHNILVDDRGALTGVLDWECVSAVPLWMACSYPAFLEGRPRHSEPDTGRYHREENGEISELYWEHLSDYETTQLRQVFIEEMERIEPDWARVFKESQLQRDFEFAVHNCDDPFQARDINAWVDDVNSGRESFPSLLERIYDI